LTCHHPVIIVTSPKGIDCIALLELDLCCVGKEASDQSDAKKGSGPVRAHASGAERARSGSPPPWAHKVGSNAIFRPALGNRDPAPPPASSPLPRPSPAPGSQAAAAAEPAVENSRKAPQSSVSPGQGSQGTAAARTAAGQPKQAPPSSVSATRSSTPDVAQASKQVPSRAPSAYVGNRSTPEPRPEPQHASALAQNGARHSGPKQRATPEHVRDHSLSGTPEPRSDPQQRPNLAQKSAKTSMLKQQSTPQHSPSGTPDPAEHAEKRQMRQAGQLRSSAPHHRKPPLRPGPGSSRDATPDEAKPPSRDATPDTVNVSSSSGLSSPKTFRESTPQQGAGGQPLNRPSPLGRPSSAPTFPGTLAHAQQFCAEYLLHRAAFAYHAILSLRPQTFHAQHASWQVLCNCVVQS